MAKVEVFYKMEDESSGIGIKVRAKDASVADLLEAWQPLCDAPDLFKNYADGNHSSCKGCQVNCCNTAYVIPDLISFKKMASHLHCSYEQFLALYFHQEKLDVGLLRMQPNPCVFLNDNICTIYPLRSLICRFYICSQISGDTEQLIYSLCWTGATATQLFAEKMGLLNNRATGGLSSFDLMFKKLIDEYRYDPKVLLFMNAREYSDIPLQPFLPDD